MVHGPHGLHLHGLHGHGDATAELKQQDAVEAARDPDSSVTPHDAEEKVIRESKKAGAAAFEFDPDASAQDKARQAKAVSGLFLILPPVYQTNRQTDRQTDSRRQ